MGKLMIVVFVLGIFSIGACDLKTIDHELACTIPGQVTCNAANEKIYCSMDYEVIKVCDVVADCETECMHELIQVLVDDIQGTL